MSLAQDVLAALTTAGIVDGATGWKGFYGYLQEQPDRAICIYETGGETPDTTAAIDRPGFQVKVRGTTDDYDAVRTKIQDCFNVLHDGDVELGAGYVYCFAVQSGPIPLGQDQNRRPLLAQNFRVMRDRPST